ncbi:hypothetical protein [Steroidobacter sp.]|nr:hypothetical protein [Steroidobacter sp.]
MDAVDICVIHGDLERDDGFISMHASGAHPLNSVYPTGTFTVSM